MNDIQVASRSPADPLESGYAVSPPGVRNGQTLLLPEPQSLSVDDAISGFLALEAQSRNLGLTRAIRNIQGIRQEQRVEWEKQKAALFEAARAQEEGGFWGDLGKLCGTIGKVAGVVASVAVAVGTGGAGLPLVLAVAGACLSTAAIAQGEFEVLQKLGVDAKASGWIELGLGLGGIVCTAGAAWAGGANSATQFQKIASTAEKVTAAAAGGVTITAGVATYKQSAANADAQDCFADAENARLNETRLDQMLIRILDDLEESEKSYRDTVGRANSAVEINDNTLLISIGRN